MLAFAGASMFSHLFSWYTGFLLNSIKNKNLLCYPINHWKWKSKGYILHIETCHSMRLVGNLEFVPHQLEWTTSSTSLSVVPPWYLTWRPLDLQPVLIGCPIKIKSTLKSQFIWSILFSCIIFHVRQIGLGLQIAIPLLSNWKGFMVGITAMCK